MDATRLLQLTDEQSAIVRGAELAIDSARDGIGQVLVFRDRFSFSTGASLRESAEELSGRAHQLVLAVQFLFGASSALRCLASVADGLSPASFASSVSEQQRPVAAKANALKAARALGVKGAKATARGAVKAGGAARVAGSAATADVARGHRGAAKGVSKPKRRRARRS